MSHGALGEVNIACGVEEMAEALRMRFPNWAQHMRVDPSGKLQSQVYNETLTNTQGKTGRIQNCSIVIPKGHRTEETSKKPADGKMPYFGDLGLERLPDGKWRFHYDDMDFKPGDRAGIAKEIQPALDQVAANAAAKWFKQNGIQASSPTLAGAGIEITIDSLSLDKLGELARAFGVVNPSIAIKS